MKKLITESLLVFAMLVFVASSAMAEMPEDVIDNSNVFQRGQNYTQIMTGKSGNDKEATTITELQTEASSPSNIDGNEPSMEQLRMIMLLLLVSQEPGKLY